MEEGQKSVITMLTLNEKPPWQFPTWKKDYKAQVLIAIPLFFFKLFIMQQINISNKIPYCAKASTLM